MSKSIIILNIVIIFFVIIFQTVIFVWGKSYIKNKIHFMENNNHILSKKINFHLFVVLKNLKNKFLKLVFNFIALYILEIILLVYFVNKLVNK